MTTVFHIQGTHCKACKMLIEDVASEVQGVKNITVDYENGSAILEHSDVLDWAGLRHAIESEGNYKVIIPTDPK